MESARLTTSFDPPVIDGIRLPNAADVPWSEFMNDPTALAEVLFAVRDQGGQESVARFANYL